MRFKIDREQFLKGLTVASKAIGSKSPIPVMMNVKLVLDEQGLSAIGSNNELTIKTVIPFKIGDREIIRDAQFGSTLVASRIITEIARRVAGTEVSFEIIDDTIAQIGDGRSSFKLNSVRPEEYPEIDLEPTGVQVSLDCKVFTQMVDQTAFAASGKEQRPILTAVNLEASGDYKLIATATDSARLARKEIALPNPAKFVANVPARVLSEISKLLEGEGTVNLAINEKKILVSFNGTIVSSRLINGDYPNTKNIVPRNFSFFLEANSLELISAMERVSLLSIERENVVKLSMGEEGVEVSSKSAEVGSAVEKISTCQYTGERLEVSFNSDYVMAAIRAAQSEDVTIAFLGEMKPFVIKNAKDESQVQLVTPVRTY
jgi:DNA polymerase III subunit beta